MSAQGTEDELEWELNGLVCAGHGDAERSEQ
jgi:hypothetical protein